MKSRLKVMDIKENQPHEYTNSYLTDKFTFVLDFLEFALEKELYYEFDDKKRKCVCLYQNRCCNTRRERY